VAPVLAGEAAQSFGQVSTLWRRSGPRGSQGNKAFEAGSVSPGTRAFHPFHRSLCRKFVRASVGRRWRRNGAAYPFFSALAMISSIWLRSSLDLSIVIWLCLICSRKASRLRRTSSRNALSARVGSSGMRLNSPRLNAGVVTKVQILPTRTARRQGAPTARLMCRATPRARSPDRLRTGSACAWKVQRAGNSPSAFLIARRSRQTKRFSIGLRRR
jgi:hypothetical protein